MIIGKYSAWQGLVIFVVAILSILNFIALTFCPYKPLMAVSFVIPWVVIVLDVYVYLLLSKLSNTSKDSNGNVEVSMGNVTIEKYADKTDAVEDSANEQKPCNNVQNDVLQAPKASEKPKVAKKNKPQPKSPSNAPKA